MLLDDSTSDVIKIEDLRLSASAVKEYKTCGKKFYLNRVAKEEPTHPENIYAWIGTTVHTSIYYSIADFVEGSWRIGTSKTLDKVKKFFELIWETDDSVDVIKNLIQENVIDVDRPNFSSRPVNDDSLVSREDLTDEEKWKSLAWSMVVPGYQLLTDVVTQLDGLKSVNLEVPISFNRYGASFIGYIDILVETKDGMVFFDLKTSKRPITQPDKDIQFFLYRHGLKEVYDLPYLPIGYYVYLRKGRLYPANSQDYSIVKELDEEVSSIITNILSGRFEPNLYSPLCPYCEYRGICYIGGSPDSPYNLLDLREKITLPEEIPEEAIVEE